MDKKFTAARNTRKTILRGGGEQNKKEKKYRLSNMLHSIIKFMTKILDKIIRIDTRIESGLFF